ncbi:phosphotransferase [Bacillus sp. FJAT-27251]|uniref:phosphotransferase enzyme family protein n=1 Tax=Bacillus sp. FJAT-27251 TaxID=1684142 RepID=UPI0006A7B700|nr:phosphotransferase [Bacillus sp. FJAT-27251]
MAKKDTGNRDNLLEEFLKIANSALKNYPNSEQLTIELLNYSENATYLAENKSNGEKYILRVCRPGYHNLSEIETELYFINSVNENTSVDVSVPVAGKTGEYIYGVNHNQQVIYCILFEFLQGKQPDVDNKEKLIKVFEKTGEVTARLHEHSINNWETFNQKKRPVWNYETVLGDRPKWGRWQDGLGITPERLELFGKVVNRIKYRLKKFGDGPDRFGLIHCDLRHANLLIDGDDVKVIDFDDSGFSWYLYDLAAALTFVEHRPYVPDLVHAWIKGYRKIRRLSKEEEQEVPTFIMMRRLQMLAWIGSRDNQTADELGSEYTEQTDLLALKYLEYCENNNLSGQEW